MTTVKVVNCGRLLFLFLNLLLAIMLRHVVSLRNASHGAGLALSIPASRLTGSLMMRHTFYSAAATTVVPWGHQVGIGSHHRNEGESQSSIIAHKNRLGILRALKAGAHQRMQVRLLASTSSDTSTDVKSKVKVMWKNYGVVAITTYLCVYLCTLSSVFLSLDYDIFNAASFGLDPAAAVQKVCDIFESVTGSQALPNYIRDHPKVGTLAIAWVMTKFTEPIRLGFTLATVPQIARWLGRVPPKDGSTTHFPN